MRRIAITLAVIMTVGLAGTAAASDRDDAFAQVKGKKASQKGSVMAAALQKGPEGWRITGWSWATR